MPTTLKPINQIVLQDPPAAFTTGEQYVIADLLTNPIVKRYLDTLLWSQMRYLASLPVTEIPDEEYKLQHAYVKGSIAMLTTLASVERPQEPNRRK